jgi:peptidoglycan/xylan/chitin deacetylase (PgdA/CDA1 family)
MNMLLSFDHRVADFSLGLGKEKGVLLCFLFHSLYENEDEAHSTVMVPQQAITLEKFTAFIEHFRDCGYRFVSPEDIAAGLDSGGKYVLLTFDDGYYNNLRALPILEKFNAPAVFFISSGHVKSGRSFWWDVCYREGRKRGQTDAEIARAITGWKAYKTEEVELHLRREFGDNSFRPIGDLDRPFTPSELRAFANHGLVFLGNHTRDHAILPNYSESGIRVQIGQAQNDIVEMTGHSPKMIAYPNGNDSPTVRNAAKKAGLCLGVGARPGHNRLPLNRGSSESMALKRFTLRGDRAIEQQCRSNRSSLSILRPLQNLKRLLASKASFPFAR